MLMQLVNCAAAVQVQALCITAAAKLSPSKLCQAKHGSHKIAITPRLATGMQHVHVYPVSEIVSLPTMNRLPNMFCKATEPLREHWDRSLQDLFHKVEPQSRTSSATLCHAAPSNMVSKPAASVSQSQSNQVRCQNQWSGIRIYGLWVAFLVYYNHRVKQLQICLAG